MTFFDAVRHVLSDTGGRVILLELQKLTPHHPPPPNVEWENIQQPKIYIAFGDKATLFSFAFADAVHVVCFWFLFREVNQSQSVVARRQCCLFANLPNKIKCELGSANGDAIRATFSISHVSPFNNMLCASWIPVRSKCVLLVVRFDRTSALGACSVCGEIWCNYPNGRMF